MCNALNDANAAALAIAFDESRRRADEPPDQHWRVAMVVRIGGGLGASTILLAPHDPAHLSFRRSTLISGTDGLAGELGHLSIDRSIVRERNKANGFSDLAPIDYEHAQCSCRAKHHLEAFASGRAYVDRLQASGYQIADDSRPQRGLIRSALTTDLDPLQEQALKDVGRIVARALASPILMLDPHSITLTGSLAIDAVLEGIRAERNTWLNAAGRSVSLTAKPDPFVGVRGAALAVIRRSVYRSYLEGKSWDGPPVPFGSSDLDRLEKTL